GSGSPYAQALRPEAAGRRDARLAGLEVVVYGWNDAPLFTSSGTAWPVTPDLSRRLYASRDSFWTRLSIGNTAYAVHFVNDRRGFYALGYPLPAFMEHATRLTEIISIVAVLLIVLLVGSTAYAPLMQAAEAPLPALFRDIRTSFYRKLFLFFVLAAVGPVVLLALAFGAYTSARIQTDIESEAVSAVAITQRLFEEFMALSDPGGTMVSDELMVVIRQMTQQDANLYAGPRLVASSQRDLFDSGLLSTRTPAGVYQAIAIDRLPAFVGEDRIGTFRYLVAAAPISGPGGEARILTVPLGTRQREIEHEIDELMRRMLAGAVVVLLFAAGLGASVAARVADPVARLSRAARQIAAGRLDVRIVADTADELRRLVDDFNVMTETLATQRAELARSNQLKAWAQMARQVAHEIKNPLTPIQLAAEHLQRVHDDRQKPLGPVVDQCVGAILAQVKLLRQIASDFSNFAAEPTPRFQTVDLAELLHEVTAPYRPGGVSRVHITTDIPPDLPPLRIDRTLISRALTNLIENALQAMPQGGTVAIRAWLADTGVALAVGDTGVGMDREAAGRAFEPYFSTKTGGSGLGLPNAKRYVELSGGVISLVSAPGEGTTVTLTLPVALPDGNASG
ncbi:MAG TPA: HAMP domain-containing sensor histidine kinase, partial [Vicinamibacterales bacterium]|nr:HAMP domain-containing sensor histidine kinase [Vicinamibacterales bacterium]